jgi:phosphopantetheine adenylyltransferase
MNIEIKSKGTYNGNIVIKAHLIYGLTVETVYCEISPEKEFIEDSFIKDFAPYNPKRTALSQDVKNAILNKLDSEGEE